VALKGPFRKALQKDLLKRAFQPLIVKAFRRPFQKSLIRPFHQEGL
jgi:hypothetical protein